MMTLTPCPFMSTGVMDSGLALRAPRNDSIHTSTYTEASSLDFPARVQHKRLHDHDLDRSG